MKVLDLGCGSARSLAHVGVSSEDEVVGLDPLPLSAAALRWPTRRFVQAHAERLPFADQSFDRCVSLLAMPYMDIPRALAEVNRVLVPGGTLHLTVHPFSFTLSELRHNALPRPVPTAFRLWVMLNGVVFHFTGKQLKFRGRKECFQTETSIVRAVRCAGFELSRVSHCPERIAVEAIKNGHGVTSRGLAS